MLDQLKAVDLQGQKQFRIIPSVYPTINFFEDLVDPSEMEALWDLENLTNERMRQDVGDIFLVPPEDRVSGPGSSVLMAAFTHIGKATRFSNGSFGIYYASLSRETAIYETVYHRERFLAATQQEACEISMRLYEGEIVKPLHDLRAPDYQRFHHPGQYAESQSFGSELRQARSYGIIYNSVRHPQGLCIAAFRPPAVTIPQHGSHLRYLWDSERITEVIDTQTVMRF